ncbi:MAG: right-handed parallel beta-helix repeat-containing protein [Prolixibacteraceae bacterium]|jgi:hypothetical protein|nr:right-handed parallel beta-helix repeat-containing protein [Prolixibacteraceae bacterium]
MKKINTILAVCLILGFSGYLSAAGNPESKGNPGTELKNGPSKAYQGVQVDPIVHKSTAINVLDFGASGSEYETTAETATGSCAIVLKEVGDFQVGQQVTVSRCNPTVTALSIREQIGLTGRWSQKNVLNAEVEVRGFDGSNGSWVVYMLDFAGTSPATFRWSDDMGLSWKGTQVQVTGEWQKLSGGVEVKLGNRDWTKPCGVSFSCRDQMESTIQKIEGNTVTLADPSPVGTKGCIIRHTDSGPLQAAFDAAVAEGRNIFIPSGRYRLTRGIILKNADGITVEGENEEHSIFDIHNGTGACLTIQGGTSVTLRNIRFIGFSSFADSWVMNGHTRPGFGPFFGFYIKHCSAVWISSPKRLLVENCHASGMSAECFYSSSRSTSREGNKEPSKVTSSIVYRNCTVTDCARNAFNNNDWAENTAILNCRIQDVGGCTWEGASRFVQFVGNYVRNAGFVLIGSIEFRDAHFDILPSGQHIVTHNTFEQQTALNGVPGGGDFAILSRAGATPVIIKDNIFVNFNSSAIQATGCTSFGRNGSLPAANTIISGNDIDLTCVQGDSLSRVGINVSADNTIISDNQIYVRGEVDPRVKGIVLSEPARNIIVHDNIIRNCAVGLQGVKQSGRITEVIDAHTFKSDGNRYFALPWPRRRSHCYRSCRLAWLPPETGSDSEIIELVRQEVIGPLIAPIGSATPGPEIETFDPDQLLFLLREDYGLKPGARFALYSSQGFNWSLHHNVINNCDRLVNLDVFGGPTAVFSDNLLSRGEVKNVEVAVSVRGVVNLTGNSFVGFDGTNSTALFLKGDQFGKTPRFVCRNNIFDQCTKPIGEGMAGAWEAAIKSGNVFGDKMETSGSK